ncbi:alanine racemase [Microbacteriaceae bacterium K1510]|nr:alanine racemase [Microbacteriaceae bacterium K1510]
MATVPTDLGEASRVGQAACATHDGSFNAVLTVDLDALQQNYAFLRRQIGGTECAAVVKSNAYGLGARDVARTLESSGCRTFFVACLEEAVALRPVLTDACRILVLNGLPAGTEALAAESEIMPVLNTLEQLAAWSGHARASGRALAAAVQIDTGMSRLGLSAAEIDRLSSRPDAFAGIDLRLVMSHLACADEPDHPANSRQLTTFSHLRHRFPAASASLANSAGIFLGTDYHFDVARPGAALYGLAPRPRGANPMRPVVRLSAPVIQIRDAAPGTAVGYGFDYRTPKATRLATVAIGYADGWPRQVSTGGSVFHAGVALPITGRVSMDTMTIDIGGLPADAIQIGTSIELIGPHQSTDAVAQAAGTIGYEILTGLGPRCQRRYVGSAASNRTNTNLGGGHSR